MPAGLSNTVAMPFPSQSLQTLARVSNLREYYKSQNIALDNGETLNIDFLLPDIVGAFQPKEFDGPEPVSPRAAMVAP